VRLAFALFLVLLWAFWPSLTAPEKAPPVVVTAKKPIPKYDFFPLLPLVELQKTPAEDSKPSLTFTYGQPPLVRGAPAGLPPVLVDVIRRVPDAERWRDQLDPGDLITWTHEATHGASAILPRVKGSHGIYVGGDKSIWIKHPKITIGQVAAAVPEKCRGKIFPLYMVEQRRYWDKEPIYLCEEWVGYVQGTICRKQIGWKKRQETERYAEELEYYCRVMSSVAKKLDPTYPDAEKLDAFIKWNAARFCDYKSMPGPK